MISKIIPLFKDILGDITSSSNYRSIALSSLILKIFDWVLLLLFEKELFTDELQFSFQDKTSTTWLAIETIDYYMRNGSEVFVGVMDMTKAFDKGETKCPVLETNKTRYIISISPITRGYVFKTNGLRHMEWQKFKYLLD